MSDQPSERTPRRQPGDPNLLWGKWAGESEVIPYPLRAHLLDTAAVAQTMWNSWVSEPLKLRLSTAMAVDTDTAGAWFAWLAGAHDLGKADPVFQGQLLAIRKGDPKFLELLAESGLPVPSDEWTRSVSAMLTVLRPHLRHEALTADILERCGAPQEWSAVLAGHHGRYPSNPSSGPYVRVEEHREWLAASAWADQHSDLLACLGLAVRRADPTRDVSIPGELIPVVTGLVVLADWLASDEQFIEESPLRQLADPRRYFETRRSQADTHLSPRLGYSVSPAGSFEQLFGFGPSRPVQVWALEQVSPSGLTVVAVPMGEGKTETALWLHAAAGESAEGLIFALPTTATTDAMFERMRAFYANTPALAHLAHGRAILNAFYSESRNNAQAICDGDAGLSSSDWFAGAHRALVAPVAASTCDQVLAVGVSHKYIAVRLASLANKHVILDEVHTYDPYQDRLLERTLTWLGSFGARVTLLTATLPTRRLQAYLTAYSEGAGAPVDCNVGAVYPAATTLKGARINQDVVKSSRSYKQRIEFHQIKTGDPDAFTADLFMEKSVNVGRNGLIVNTVDRAIRVAKIVRSTFPELILLHSRMTANQRFEATRRVLAICGKQSGPGLSHVVSTQIAEASLDIDFDVLVSDLAPMTSLLQRMGRQWRHSQPSDDGTWKHRVGFEYRKGNPKIHLTGVLNSDGNPAEAFRFPYTQAEIMKTWIPAEALSNGTRTQLCIPDDLQAAVDAADISFDDLADADLAGLAETDLLDHLGAAMHAMGVADAVGVGAGQVREGWETDPEWEACGILGRLTDGDLWRADATTRLRDSFTIELLVCDPTGENQFALEATPESVMEIYDREMQKQVLGHVIPVSGKLAKGLIDASQLGGTDDWRRQKGVLMRSLTPVDLNDVSALCRLTEFGLEKPTEGATS